MVAPSLDVFYSLSKEAICEAFRASGRNRTRTTVFYFRSTPALQDMVENRFWALAEK